MEELRKRGVEAYDWPPHPRSIPRIGRAGRPIFDYKKREKYARVGQRDLARYQLRRAFLHHQPFLNALDVRNARITLPLQGAREKPRKRS